MNFFTSDSHFCHNNIIRYCKRPYATINEMNEALIANWNAKVGKDDTVWHLGDIAIGPNDKVESVFERLNGKIHLIFGNHDKHSFRRMPYWESVQDYAEISVDGQKICLSHYAMRAWNGSHKGAYQLYGHTHAKLPPINRSTDVGVDMPFTNYAPVTLAEIKTFLSILDLDVVPHLEPRPE